MERFNIQIQPPYDSKLKSPEIIGTYAMNYKREWQETSFVKVYDSQYWRRQCLEKNPLDLKQGRVILGGDDYYNEGIKPLLKWIHRHSEWSHSDFVLSRSSLSKMMRTPYEEKEPWMFSVTKYEGTIYIKMEQTEYERIRGDNREKTMEDIFKWGYKFEDYLTQTSTSNLNDIVNTNQQNHVVYRREIDRYNVLYGAEVDAVMYNRATPLRLEDCVEFKVNNVISSAKHYETFAKRKLLQWWTQSYLVGIPTIVCGFRNNNGIVRKIENFSVRELPKGMEWRQDVCKTFLANLLKSLRNDMIVKSNVVYNISWIPTALVISAYETQQPLSNILPSWYTRKGH